MKTGGLSKRERHVLDALVKAYVTIGDPIGSRTLFEREDLGISPATIRHALGRLEERGYVRQPHTSAGRIPTDKAYRAYVEGAMVAGSLAPTEDDVELERELGAKVQEGGVAEILGQLAKAIGDLSQQLGVVLAPRFELGVFDKMELVGLSDKRLMLVVTIKQGLAKSLVIEVDSRVSRRDMTGTSRLLNERLHGLTMAEIQRSVRQRLGSAKVQNRHLLRAVLEEIEGLTRPSVTGLHVAGASNICMQPEFRDPQQVAGLMELVEQKDVLAHALRGRRGMVITIGEENTPRQMRLCSMVTASYEIGGVPGVLGVIGPTRMPYGRVMALVTHAASRAPDLVI